MADDTEITSGKDGSLTWKKGKTSHICTKENEIEEIHNILFNKEGLIEQVNLINERQKKALDTLKNVEKDLVLMMKDIARIEGEKKGQGISYGWTATLIGIALAVGAFIMNLLKK